MLSIEKGIQKLFELKDNPGEAETFMESHFPGLRALGLRRENFPDEPFVQETPDLGDEVHLGRILQENREGYLIALEQGQVFAEPAGRLFQDQDLRSLLPSVGDWVMLTIPRDQEIGVVQQTLPRISALVRKMPGKREKVQVIAANVDRVFIITSLDNGLNMRKLERFLVAVTSGGARPVILLSKTDLLEQEQVEDFTRSAVEGAMDVQVIAYSAVSGQGIQEIRGLLEPFSTVCFVGSSGVGKSTLLNVLAGSDLAATGQVREIDSKGRHTTTHREIFFLPCGSMILDTPGIRELALWEAGAGIEETFHDVLELAGECRFSNCSHLHEPECGVLGALASGQLSRERYESFLKLSREATSSADRKDFKSREAQKKKERKLSVQIRKYMKSKQR